MDVKLVSLVFEMLAGICITSTSTNDDIMTISLPIRLFSRVTAIVVATGSEKAELCLFGFFHCLFVFFRLVFSKG